MNVGYNSTFESNVTYNADFEPSPEISGLYLYLMTIGEEVFNGKVIIIAQQISQMGTDFINL